MKKTELVEAFCMISRSYYYLNQARYSGAYKHPDQALYSEREGLVIEAARLLNLWDKKGYKKFEASYAETEFIEKMLSVLPDWSHKVNYEL